MMLQPTWCKANPEFVLTDKLVRDYWDFLSREYGATIAAKDDDDFMEMVGWALERMKVLDQKRFLKEYTTTIGKKIYLNVPLLDSSRSRLSWLTLGAHETTHVVQSNTLQEKFLLPYIFSKTARATFEADATRTAFELIAWNKFSDVQNLDPRLFANHLYDYGLGDEHIEYVANIHKKSIGIVAKGGLVTPVGKASIVWLNRRIASYQ